MYGSSTDSPAGWEYMLTKGVKNTNSQHMAAGLYLFALGLYLVGSLLTEMTFETGTLLPRVLRYAALFLMGVKLVFFDAPAFPGDQGSRKYRYLRLAAVFLILLTGIVSMCISGFRQPLFWVVILAGAWRVSFTDVLKVYCTVITAGLIIAVVSSSAGIIPDLVYTVSIGGVSCERHSLGITYPTDLTSHVFFLILAMTELFRDARRYGVRIAALLLAFLTWRFCYVRLDLICLLLTGIIPAAAGLIDRIAERSLSPGRAACLIMPFFAALSLILTLFYNEGSEFFSNLNRILNSRLALGRTALTEHLSLWGSGYELVGNGGGPGASAGTYNFVDCSYIYGPVEYGVIFSLLVLAVYAVCAGRYYRDRCFVFCIFMISLHAVAAHHLWDPSYVIFMTALFASGDCIRKQRSPKMEKEQSAAEETGDKSGTVHSRGDTE